MHHARAIWALPSQVNPGKLMLPAAGLAWAIFLSRCSSGPLPQFSSWAWGTRATTSGHSTISESCWQTVRAGRPTDRGIKVALRDWPAQEARRRGSCRPGLRRSPWFRDARCPSFSISGRRRRAHFHGRRASPPGQLATQPVARSNCLAARRNAGCGAAEGGVSKPGSFKDRLAQDGVGSRPLRLARLGPRLRQGSRSVVQPVRQAPSTSAPPRGHPPPHCSPAARRSTTGTRPHPRFPAPASTPYPLPRAADTVGKSITASCAVDPRRR